MLLIILAVVGALAWYFFVTKPKPKQEVPKDQPIAVRHYSGAFNQSIDSFLSNYYRLTEAFVNWDSLNVTQSANQLNTALGNVKWNELQQDTAIYQTASSYSDVFKNDLATLTGTADLTTKRHSFHSLSQNLYDMLRTVKYDKEKLYLQQCPMAFNENEEGLWLSKNEAIRNPYMGLHHPKYKGGMINCGETKDTLNFEGRP